MPPRLQHKRTGPRKRGRACRVRGHQEPVRGTAHGCRATVQYVGVDHGRADIGVAKELLDGSDACLCVARRQVVSIFKEVSGPAQCGINSGVPQGVAGAGLGNPHLF
jgi:hypothetical protein